MNSGGWLTHNCLNFTPRLSVCSTPISNLIEFNLEAEHAERKLDTAFLMMFCFSFISYAERRNRQSVGMGPITPTIVGPVVSNLWLSLHQSLITQTSCFKRQYFWLLSIGKSLKFRLKHSLLWSQVIRGFSEPFHASVGILPQFVYNGFLPLTSNSLFIN
jgi:hypothetical protein